jgi:integrase
MKLTKLVVDNLDTPKDRDQVFYRDDILKGFAVRVTSNGVKSFIVEKLVNGKVRRMTLGRYGELTVELARKEAQKLLGKIATGIDPIAEKKSVKMQAVTLGDTFKDYLATRKELKPNTLYNYTNIMNLVFSDWKSKLLLSITKDNVAKRHTHLGEKHGAAYANAAMRVLRLLFNFAAGQYEDGQGHSLITENPVKRLSQTRAWYRVKTRQTYIKPHELTAWYQAVLELQNETLRDYLLLLLMTGLRRQEAAQLKWDHIDFKAKTLVVHDTKNHQPHNLPLSDYLYEFLQKRKDSVVDDSVYVFPGAGKGGYIIEPRKQMARVTKASGVQFTVHDLRRTFITTAESLDISAYALKRLLNHKMNNDITAGYIVTDVERLRKPMQQITDHFVKLMTNEVQPGAA